jgi:hypothetical protein
MESKSIVARQRSPETLLICTKHPVSDGGNETPAGQGSVTLLGSNRITRSPVPVNQGGCGQPPDYRHRSMLPQAKAGRAVLAAPEMLKVATYDFLG